MKTRKFKGISILCTLLIFSQLFALAGCAPRRSNVYMERMGKEAAKWAKSYDHGNPPSLTVYITTGDYAEDPVSISNPETINNVFDALSDITVQKKADESEDRTTYTFTFAGTDGSKQSFTLCGDDCVLLDQKIYHATGVDNVLNAAYLSVEDDESLMGDLDFEDSLAQTEEEENEPQEQENDADADTNAEEGTDYGDYTVFSSEPMEFSFLYLSSYTAQMSNGGGAVIYTGSTLAAPFLQILHVLKGPDAWQYLEEQRYSAQMQFEENLLEDSGEPTPLGVEGRDIYGIRFAYPDSNTGAALEVMSFAENLSDQSVAVYTATYFQNDPDATVQALKDAMNSFVPDASYYTQGSSSSGQTSPDQSSDPQTSAAYELEYYDGGNFTMNLPKGWKIETAGEYAGFGFHAYDPANPDVQIFYYGELGPYFRSEEGKATYQQMSPAGDPYKYGSVLTPKTVLGCLSGMDEYEQFYNSVMSPAHSFPVLHDLSNISEQPITTFLSDIAVSESMIMADLTSASGSPCVGIFQGSIADANPYDTYDFSPSVCAMNIFGVVAPKSLFASVSPTLTRSLCSFRFTEEYIKEGMNYTDAIGQNAGEYSRRNMEMMDNITENFIDYINGSSTSYTN